MSKKFSRITAPVFIGVVIYLFTACSVFTSAQKEKPVDSLSQSKLETSIKEINKKIENGSATADTYYQKGYLLSELAKKKESSIDRSSLYKEMHSSLKRAEKLFNEVNLPSGKQKTDDLLKVTWSKEHNQGVEIIQTDSTLTGELLKRAADHFYNATVILPDTAISYKMKAQAHYRNHNIDKALSTLQRATEHIDHLPPDMLEQLAFLYLETGQTDKAVQTYEEAETFSDQNLNLLHGLANAYMAHGEHRKALDLLDVLTENEPKNIIYIQAKGTELFKLGAEYLDSLSKKGLSFDRQEELFARTDSLFSNAELAFQKALKENPEEIEIKETLAGFYQNSAVKYQKAVPAVDDKVEPSLKEKINEYLNASIPLYVSLSEERPDVKSYKNHLYRAYVYLGMDEKASKVKNNLN